MNKIAFARHASKCLANPALNKKVKKLVRQCSPNGVLCTRKQYDAKRPPTMPHSSKLCSYLGSWERVAEWAGLNYAFYQRKGASQVQYSPPPPLESTMQGIEKTKRYFDWNRHIWVTGKVIVLR